MCGRFALSSPINELITTFVAQGGKAENWRPSYSIAPTNEVPVLRAWTDDGQLTRDLELASWGYRPSWAKAGGRAPINARLESVATNGLFRGGFAGQRCLVPMSPGYFEWVDQEDGKQPYLIHGHGEVLAAAGLYAANKVGDEWKINFTIITREARDASGKVHDRMPAFVQPDLWAEWLSPEKLEDKDGMLALLEHTSTDVAASLTTYPVDRQLNNVRTVNIRDPHVVDAIDL